MLARAIDNGFFCHQALVRDLGSMPCALDPNSQNSCARLTNCTVKLLWPFSPEAAPDF
jgi:hypothetical protein